MHQHTWLTCATGIACITATAHGQQQIQASEFFNPQQIEAMLDASYVVGSWHHPELVVPLPSVQIAGFKQPVSRQKVYKGICGPGGAHTTIDLLYEHALLDLSNQGSRGSGIASSGTSPRFHIRYDTDDAQITPVEEFIPACLDAAFYIGGVMDNRVNIVVDVSASDFNTGGVPNTTTLGTASATVYTIPIFEYTDSIFWKEGLSDADVASWLGASVPAMFQGDAAPTSVNMVTITQAQMRAIFGDNVIATDMDDVDIQFNTRFNFEFGPCGQDPAPDATSLITVAVHELTHALGFRSGISGPPRDSNGNPTPTQNNNPDRDLTSLDLLRFRTVDIPTSPSALFTSLVIGQGFFNELHYYVNPLATLTPNDPTIFFTFLESGDDNQPAHLANTPGAAGYLGVMEPAFTAGDTLCPEFYTPSDFQPLDDMGWTMRFYERNADCNGNGVADSIDIAFGSSNDSDGDLIPDECEFFESDTIPEPNASQGVTVSVFDMRGAQVELSLWNSGIGFLDEKYRLDSFESEVMLPNDGSGRIVVMDAKIYVPAEDEYAFRLACPDQSELYINDALIMAEYNDGSRMTNDTNDPNASSAFAKQAFVQLREGYHDIQVRVNTVGDGDPDHVSLMYESFNLGGWQIVPSTDLRTVGFNDCNGNDIDDAFEIDANDCNNNGLLDECEYPTIADAIDLGVVSTASFVNIRTEGSSFDTEVMLWDAAGNFIAADDDCGSQLWSCLGLDLGEGEYFLAVAGYNTGPTEDFGVVHFGCTSGGDLVLNVAGTVDNREVPAGNHLYYRFVIADGDCDGDTIPDSQELDCDNNGVADECEVANPGNAPFIGPVGTSDQVTDFNTFGRNMDTEIAIWDAAGTLLAQNNDANGTLQSQILIQLPPGIYYIGFGGNNHEFSDDFGIAPIGCTVGGSFDANIGSWSDVGSIPSGRSAMLSFEILPGDCDGDGILDDMELDCDQDGFPDECQRPLVADAVPLGTVGNASEVVQYSTFGSDFDTEIAIWGADGTLLAQNDDVQGTLQSQIDIQLEEGTYYIGLSGYDTAFDSGFGFNIINCSVGGAFVLNAGDMNLTGGVGAGRGMYLSFEIAPPPCAADINQDGLLNFFDVSEFVTGYSNQDPASDFDGNGLFNFFDVSAFLSAYGAGCP